MTSHADFLVELGTEELPPKALQRLERAFADGVRGGIEEAGLEHGEIASFATPRRLAVLVFGLQTEQPDSEVEKRGPSVQVAFDEAGNPTRAAEAFAKGCGVEVAALERTASKKGEWLFFRGIKAGEQATDLLPGIVERALNGLPVPKRMRWGAGDAEFVRPVHWLVMLLGDAVVPATILGVAAGAETRGHRFLGEARLTLNKAGDYAAVLEKRGHVLADFAARRAQVEQLAQAAGTQADGQVELDAAVVNEVTALVEWPVPVVGRFEARFLELPAEVLIATLQDHQRYFPVRGKDGGLLPAFVAMSNLASADPGQVQAGNEKVVRPRLDDAAFFWQKDREQPLAERRERLRDIVFQQQLGSVFDKSLRVAELAERVAAELSTKDNGLTNHVRRAAELAKVDLVTDMVGEFPELQGRMGYYYAAADGEHESVALAIDEHYQPRQAGDALPDTPAGCALAIADRLDTLAGIFAIGKKPTGNKDPFALRRAALGLLRILIERDVSLDLSEFIGFALSAQPVDIDEQSLGDELFEFMMDRLRAYYLDGHAPELPKGAISAELFAAIRARRPASPLDFHQRLLAVRDFMNLDAAHSLAQANKRIANILKGASEQPDGHVTAELFEEAAEQTLHVTLTGLKKEHSARLARRDYAGVLADLAQLQGPVDQFFDSVMVMTEDAPRRENRLALLSQLRGLFLDVADLSVLPVN